MNMDTEAITRIQILEAENADLTVLLDLAHADIDDRDERIAVLEEAIRRMKLYGEAQVA